MLRVLERVEEAHEPRRFSRSKYVTFDKNMLNLGTDEYLYE